LKNRKKAGLPKTALKSRHKRFYIMALYKLTAKRQYGDMPKDYEFQVPSRTTPTPNASEIAEVIKR
jgi:hypothetical protein